MAADGSDGMGSTSEDEVEVSDADMARIMAIEKDLESNPKQYDKHIEVRRLYCPAQPLAETTP